MTTVEVGAQTNINGIEYELVGTVDHRGNKLDIGHYVSHVKREKGPWVFCDDAHITVATLDRVNNDDNYIFLFKKKGTHPTNIDLNEN